MTRWKSISAKRIILFPISRKVNSWNRKSSGCLANASFGTCPKFHSKTVKLDSKNLICRYLRASKWKLVTAINRIENTLSWRREYGLYDILNANFVEPEVCYKSDVVNALLECLLITNCQAVTGKQITFGFDAKGKPAFYMFPSRQNTTDPARQIQFVVWMLERVIDLMGPGVE